MSCTWTYGLLTKFLTSCPANWTSFGVTRVKAVPFSPALPVRPMRWTWVSMLLATSKFITVFINGISRPLAVGWIERGGHVMGHVIDHVISHLLHQWPLGWEILSSWMLWWLYLCHPGTCHHEGDQLEKEREREREREKEKISIFFDFLFISYLGDLHPWGW